MAVKVDSGPGWPGDVRPEFAQLSDDVLLGEVCSREEKLSLRDRALVTVAALILIL